MDLHSVIRKITDGTKLELKLESDSDKVDKRPELFKETKYPETGN